MFKKWYMKSALLIISLLLIQSASSNEIDIQNIRITGDYSLPNVLPPLDDEDDQQYLTNASQYCPVADELFEEHVRVEISDKDRKRIEKVFAESIDSGFQYPANISKDEITAIADQGEKMIN